MQYVYGNGDNKAREIGKILQDGMTQFSASPAVVPEGTLEDLLNESPQ
jgi:hypothetical protein